MRYNRTVYDSALLKYKVLGKDVHLIKDNKEEATNIWDMAKSIRVGNAGTKQGVVARIMELEERDNVLVLCLCCWCPRRMVTGECLQIVGPSTT